MCVTPFSRFYPPFPTLKFGGAEAVNDEDGIDCVPHVERGRCQILSRCGYGATVRGVE